MEKHNGEEFGRREFLGAAAIALLAGAAAQLLGCNEVALAPAAGADNTPVPQTGTPSLEIPVQPQIPGSAPVVVAPAADRVGTISSNHGHVAVVTTAQQDAGSALNLNIQGTSGHSHTVALSAADIMNLKAGKQVALASSSSNGHSHNVTWSPVTSIYRDPLLG